MQHTKDSLSSILGLYSPSSKGVSPLVLDCCRQMFYENREFGGLIAIMENQKSLSVKEQVVSLKKRGMQLDDVSATNTLSIVNYFTSFI